MMKKRICKINRKTDLKVLTPYQYEFLAYYHFVH